MPPISLSEVLYHDPRLPKSIQLDLDYTSPDFVLDSNISSSADMFSLGLLLLALYNSPHSSPLKTNSNMSTYKKLFTSSSTTPSSSNNFLSSRPLPNDLKSSVLPRLITRRPAQRMNAREFQQSQFFDNILVSSIRFLDSLPAKTPNEKAQFMRGLPKILDQFPKSVLDKKVLPALLEETKDKELLSLILQNVFKAIDLLTSGQRAMTDKILPQLREIFLTTNVKSGQQERDPAKEAGLVVVLENIKLIGENCNGKEFKDDVLPILQLGLESSTHAIVDKALSCLPTVLAILDFSTIKNEVFPVVAAVFSKTSSLGIKVRGLEAFVILCGGSSTEDDAVDDLDGGASASRKAKQGSNAVLDKYTVQEKVVPLLKAMKTKEPAVMMAALAVFKQVGKIADAEFLAMEALPILWSFSLGPLLNLQQFQQYMDLIKKLSTRIETEQIRKLRDLSSSNANNDTRTNNMMNFGSTNGFSNSNGNDDVGQTDFESLVLGKGRANGSSNDMLGDGIGFQPQPNKPAEPPTFSWSSPPSTTQQPRTNSISGIMTPMNPQSRTITPDQSLNSFAPLNPASATTPRPANNSMTNGLNSFAPMQPMQPSSSINSPQWGSAVPLQPTLSQLSQQPKPPTYHLPIQNQAFSTPNPSQGQGSAAVTPFSTFSLPPPPTQQQQQQRPGLQQQGSGYFGATAKPGNIPVQAPPGMGQGGKSGLDKYESLI